MALERESNAGATSSGRAGGWNGGGSGSGGSSKSKKRKGRGRGNERNYGYQPEPQPEPQAQGGWGDWLNNQNPLAQDKPFAQDNPFRRPSIGNTVIPDSVYGPHRPSDPTVAGPNPFLTGSATQNIVPNSPSYNLSGWGKYVAPTRSLIGPPAPRNNQDSRSWVYGPPDMRLGGREDPHRLAGTDKFVPKEDHIPTDTFFGGGGNYLRGAMGVGVWDRAAGSWRSKGPNGGLMSNEAYWDEVINRGWTPPGYTDPDDSGGGGWGGWGGYGSHYGRGGGRGGGWGSNDWEERKNPAYMNLASWNIK